MKNETARREIKSLDYYLQNHTNDYSEKSHVAMMMAIEALEKEPKTGEWIPVSERLPSERGWYLITVQDVNRFTDMDYYYGNSEWDEVSSKQEVIAWMPLPEPYREDDEP